MPCPVCNDVAGYHRRWCTVNSSRTVEYRIEVRVEEDDDIEALGDALFATAADKLGSENVHWDWREI